MTYRTARRGSALVGALLLALPFLEVGFGFAEPGPIHFIVAMLGVSLLALGGRLR
ncbi:MAG TPA: hypothetical protein VF211_10255 [Burkholderiales bacterium]